MAKSSLTLNPLAKPSSPIQALAVQFQDYLHFPDPAPLYCVMGAVAANMTIGNPVWLMLVGPPSCGKTELLNTLMDIPKMVPISTLNGSGSLLSGATSKGKPSTGGVLRQVGKRGGIVIKDFTSILTLNDKVFQELEGNLREIYDGKWDRQIGAEGGKHMKWEGKCALLSGCTQKIDTSMEFAAEMGERWVMYRYPEQDGYQQMMRSLSNKLSPEQSRKELRQIVKTFFDVQDLTFEKEQPKRDFAQWEKTKIWAMSSISSRARTPVSRNHYTKEVESFGSAEVPTRLGQQLGQLLAGMETVGVEEEECWRIAGKVAWDCIPPPRAKILAAMVGKGKGKHAGVPVTVFRDMLHLGNSATKRIIEDMTIYGLTERVPDKSGKKLYRIPDEVEHLMRLGWGKHLNEF